jgi:anti-sigma factor RsiW
MTTHRELEDLLVSYVNGTASREESDRVQVAIKEDHAMAAEYRLLTALRSAVKVPSGDTPGEFGLERFRRTLDRHLREERRVRFWRALTALAASLFIGVAILHLVNPAGDEAAGYRALSAHGVGTLQLRFQDSATSAQMQDVFRDLQLDVVAGPSALGVYRVRLRENDTPATRDEALRQLRERVQVVEFAELDP